MTGWIRFLRPTTRPEHLNEAGFGEGQFAGEVLVIEHLGGESYIYVHTEAEGMIVVQAAGESKARIGDNIKIGMPASAVHLFNQDGLALTRDRDVSQVAA